MNENILKLIFNLVSWLGGTGIVVFGLLQGWNTWNDRILKEATTKAKENSVGEAALAKLMEGYEIIKKDMAEIDKEINNLKEDMFNEKKELHTRLEKLREHFDEMNRDYYKLLLNK